MRWEGQRESDNVEDRRGMGPARAGGLGLGGLLLVLAVSYFTGTNPLTLINMFNEVQSPGMPPVDDRPVPQGALGDRLGKFASIVLADTETTWQTLLGLQYQEPRMVLFTGAVRSACGTTSSAVGPFYCPGDHKLYLDLSFFDEMAQRLGAPGDFAQAYVIAHEVGHHVQNLMGIADKVHRLRQRSSEAEGNALSVRMELQADCLQKMSRGYVQPESWTHGSSEQRMIWLKRGLDSGDPAVCDTFSSNHL